MKDSTSHDWRIRRGLWIVAAGVALLTFLVPLSCTQPLIPPTPDQPDMPGDTSGPFVPVINAGIAPVVPDKHLPMGSSRDSLGVTSDFLEGLVIVRPKSDIDLQDFLVRYDGTIVRDNTIPQPPARLGITLTDEARKPTEFVVRINFDSVDVLALQADGAAAGLTGMLEFSSEAAMQTYAAVFSAKAAGFTAQIDYVYEGTQTFPTTLFQTSERPVSPATVPPTFTDPFTAAAFSDFGTGGNQSNVLAAWQFIAAHGIQRRTTVAIIDGGFWLDTTGRAKGADSDFRPAPFLLDQYDFDGVDYIADDVNPNNCSGGSLCYWHGTGSASVATGIANNQLGAIGTGGQVADPMLFRFDGSKHERNAALRTAVAWGADVVSMSFGGNCNQGCRVDDRDNNPFDDAIGSGSKTIFIASAGNGAGTPAVGYDVSINTFVHPCTEDNVLCVGALNPGTNTKIGYSNFGGRVQIFAPTNIPVMSYPNSVINNPTPPNPPNTPSTPLTPAQSIASPEQPQVFGGTSASAPFVAGVVAMMKAVNPDLGQHDVEKILIETAGPGAAPVSRTVNAYAAVKRAAEGFAIVRDRFENNDLDTIPTDLGATPPYVQANLNIDGRERDYFKFQSPGGSLMTVTLQYPPGLGNVSIFNLVSLGDACAQPTFIPPATFLPGGGQTFIYRVPGGPLRIGLTASDVNAYNLGITFASAAYLPDAYESNDSVATAKRLGSIRSHRPSDVLFVTSDPRVTLDATLHTATDVDYYIVRGATATLAEQILLNAVPTLSVYGNDSLIRLDVYRLNADNTQGPLVSSQSGGSCAEASLALRLDSDVYYLIRVSGSPGQYKLSNSIKGEKRRIPSVGRDRAYEILNPLDPIEHVLRNPEVYVFLADQAYSAVRASGLGLQMQLFEFDGALVAEGVPDGASLRLDLSNTHANIAYALQLVPPADAVAEPPLVKLQWEAVVPTSVTENLVRNPGAEIVGGENDIQSWNVVPHQGNPRLYFYDADPANPSPDGPGPLDRGFHLFAGGDNSLSGLRQTSDVDQALFAAINEGRVGFSFSAYLGGNGVQADSATGTLTFLDANLQVLGRVGLPPVTALDREGVTGLFPVEADGYVPVSTRYTTVDLTFRGGDGVFNDAYADNVALILSTFAPR